MTVKDGASDNLASLERSSANLQARVSTLLTHVSIMIAIVSGFLFASSQGNPEKFDLLIVAEIMAYILVCVICLGTLAFRVAGGQGHTPGEDILLRAEQRKRSQFQLAYLVTMALTVLFMGQIAYIMCGGKPITRADAISAMEASPVTANMVRSLKN